MQNTASKLPNRGIRKTNAFMVLGNHEAIIFPMFLHVNAHKQVRGILLKYGESPQEFAVPIAEFKNSDVRMVKD